MQEERNTELHPHETTPVILLTQASLHFPLQQPKTATCVWQEWIAFTDEWTRRQKGADRKIRRRQKKVKEKWKPKLHPDKTNLVVHVTEEILHFTVHSSPLPETLCMIRVKCIHHELIYSFCCCFPPSMTAHEHDTVFMMHVNKSNQPNHSENVG